MTLCDILPMENHTRARPKPQNDSEAVPFMQSAYNDHEIHKLTFDHEIHKLTFQFRKCCAGIWSTDKILHAHNPIKYQIHRRNEMNVNFLTYHISGFCDEDLTGLFH